jgi:hypothetical protein
MRYKIDHPEAINAQRNKLGMSITNAANVANVAYTQWVALERGHTATADGPTLDAIAATLECHPTAFASSYEAPEPVLTQVYPRVEMLKSFLDQTGWNPNMLAREANVHPSLVYKLAWRGGQSCSAVAAVKLAKAMDILIEEFCPALAHYDPAGS